MTPMARVFAETAIRGAAHDMPHPDPAARVRASLERHEAHCERCLEAEVHGEPSFCRIRAALAEARRSPMVANAVRQGGHRADGCPRRIDITLFGDEEPRFLHGGCTAP